MSGYPTGSILRNLNGVYFLITANGDYQLIMTPVDRPGTRTPIQ